MSKNYPFKKSFKKVTKLKHVETMVTDGSQPVPNTICCPKCDTSFTYKNLGGTELLHCPVCKQVV